ncbi:MAG: S9 family peptidase [Bacteroidales bacterium]|nr:MAG: S9 family peptidase [Bacteroidales bacterium]
MSRIYLISILGFLILFFSCTFEKPRPDIPGETEFVTELTTLEKEGGVLTPEILWKFGRVSDPQLSPDEKTIIYTVTRYDVKTNTSNTNILSVSADGGEASLITSMKGSEFNQRWHPQGQKIGFLHNDSTGLQFWEINTDGSNPRRISNFPGGINRFEYSPDGKNLFYTQDVKLDETPTEKFEDLPLVNVRIIDDLMYRHWNSWHDYAYSHIFVTGYDADTLVEGEDILFNEPYDTPLSPYFDPSEITWSPDSKKIAYTCKKLRGREYTISTNSDIYLYDIESGETRNLTEGMPGYDKYPVFSPDGKKIAYQSMETPGYEADKDRLFLYDIESGRMDYLTRDFDQNVKSLTWNPDGTRLFFISGIKATYQIYSIEPDTKEILQITEGKHNYTSLLLAGESLIGTKMSMSMATEIFKINPETGEEKQLTHTNQNIYDYIEMGNVEERWIETTDGKEMLVWVIYPPGFDPEKVYPALLYCQGGPQSAVSQFFSFRWNFQIMAANDYVIIAPNRRGLPTFGIEWNEQISGDYGGQNMKDYLSAADALKKEPFIDENSLGAVGASYGGFSVFWLAGNHNKRFKVFIAHCGIFNFESMYASTEEMFFVNHDYGGAYWEKDNKTAQKSYATSPHKFVQNWDTPILIITGANDFRIPYTESLQAFNAAQLLGIPSKLLFFPDETHFVTKPQNSILWQREFFAWLDEYLK